MPGSGLFVKQSMAPGGSIIDPCGIIPFKLIYIINYICNLCVCV